LALPWCWPAATPTGRGSQKSLRPGPPVPVGTGPLTRERSRAGLRYGHRADRALRPAGTQRTPHSVAKHGGTRCVHLAGITAHPTGARARPLRAAFLRDPGDSGDGDDREQPVLRPGRRRGPARPLPHAVAGLVGCQKSARPSRARSSVPARPRYAAGNSPTQAPGPAAAALAPACPARTIAAAGIMPSPQSPVARPEAHTPDAASDMPPGQAGRTPTLGIPGTARRREHPADSPLRAESAAGVVTPETTHRPHTRIWTSPCSGPPRRSRGDSRKAA